ncbi:MAG: SMI1/KNR4 family protein [Planctomycetaceae bacterium]
MNWTEYFDNCRTEPGATDSEIDTFVLTVSAPLTSSEVQELLEEHRQVVGDGCFDPPFKPESWRLPTRSLPSGYLDLLRFSNGGFFDGQHRDLDPLFSTREVRDYMLGYSVPHWMPMTLPFAFDGGGGFYLLDMRDDSLARGFPVIWAHACNLCFEDARLLAPSFMDFIESGLGPE